MYFESAIGKYAVKIANILSCASFFDAFSACEGLYLPIWWTGMWQLKIQSVWLCAQRSEGEH